MNEFTQLLGNLPATVTNVLQQVAQGNHGAVPDAAAQEAYNHLVPQLSADEFQQVAAQAYARLSPDQRAELAQYMREQAPQDGLRIPTVPSTAAADDPSTLAAATAHLQGQGPGFLQQLFAPNGVFSSPIAKAALLGITAMAAQRLAGRR